MKTKLIILGCGDSMGIPRIDGDWGNCNIKNKRNIRTRCSAIILKGSNYILIYTSPDIRNQFTTNKIENISSVIFTHEHADQTNGLFELRAFFWKYKKRINVYGNLPKTIITEEQPTKPINAYGLTHLLSENICNYYNEKTETECINVRLSNSYGSPVFGENNCWWLVINDFCKSAKVHGVIKLLSDGSPQRDFIYSTDVCKAVEIIINNDNNNLQKNIFHISSGNTYSILELAHTVKNIFQNLYQEEINVVLPENKTSLTSKKFLKDENFIIDNEKIRSLGFVAKTELKTGINMVFDYLDKNL